MSKRLPQTEVTTHRYSSSVGERRIEANNVPLTATQAREREAIIRDRDRERERQRERDYYDEDIYIRRKPEDRPEFLRDDYGRSDRAPLVRRAREVERSTLSSSSAYAPRSLRRQSSLDTLDRRPRSPSPIRYRERIIERSPSPPPNERLRTRSRYDERPRERLVDIRRDFPLSQSHDGKYLPPEKAPLAPVGPDEVNKLTIVEHHTTRYQEVDEVIWDLSRTKDVTLHRTSFPHTNALLHPMRAKSVGNISVLFYVSGSLSHRGSSEALSSFEAFSNSWC